MAEAPRVFLSYSHDWGEHADRVLALADALRDRGIDGYDLNPADDAERRAASTTRSAPCSGR